MRAKVRAKKTIKVDIWLASIEILLESSFLQIKKNYNKGL